MHERFANEDASAFPPYLLFIQTTDLTLDKDLSMKTSRFLTSTLAAAALLIGTPVSVAMAQAPEPAPASEASPETEAVPGSEAAPETEAVPEAEANPVSATEVSETQLDSFANAYRSIQAIQESAQAELVAAVEGQGLTVDDYNAIAEAQESPDAAAQIPPEQSEQFAAAAEQVSAIRTEVQAEMEAAIQAENLSIEEFEQILALAQQDPEVQQAISERLAE
ncbi:MAG: DUF4168 domain-containing protein [Leptolyngbyaceae cyanobacterium SM2_5_2]|nr:DUF4168 domain-containing protein [Leptolyngbyaceae cyanobacterium SM2_5_2]